MYITVNVQASKDSKHKVIDKAIRNQDKGYLH